MPGFQHPVTHNTTLNPDVPHLIVESETISSGIPSAAMSSILRDHKIWSTASVEHLMQDLRVLEGSLGCSDRSDVSQDILR